MKIKQKFKNILNQYSKEKIFLWGFYISFLIVMTLAATIDFMIGNNPDAYIEVVFILLTIINFIYYRVHDNMTIAIYGIIILATLTTYALLISNSFNISIFHTIVPLGYFLLFSLKRSLIYTFIHQSIVVGIYIYGSICYPYNLILHDPATITAIILASLMIIFFGVVYHISVENSYHQLEKSNRQKELLLQEVHHRVKNNLNIISSILGLQLIGETRDEIRQILQKNRLRIDSISMVHEQLYRENNFETINIHEYLYNLIAMVVELYDQDVTININQELIHIPFEDTLKLGIITNELTINSIKHAFKKNSGTIKLCVTKKDNEYHYEYQDNGEKAIDMVSIKESNNLGLKLITMMVEQMEATLEIKEQKGLAYKIRIPIEA